MAKVYATPGVYIEEKNAFPSSVVAVPTAVPAFIGYTEKAERNKKDITNIPTRITSLAEYIQFFGGAPPTKFTIEAEAGEEDSTADVNYDLAFQDSTRFMLFSAMRLFYANGGGPCYIVSIGDYSGGISGGDFKGVNDETKQLKGLTTLKKEQEPTMVVIPDAVLLEKNDCYSLYQEMIMHCGFEMKSRMAILDVHEGHDDKTIPEDINDFREGVGTNFLAFSAAYYPWLHTTITQADDVDFNSIDNDSMEGLKGILLEQVQRDSDNGLLDNKRKEQIDAEINRLEPGLSGSDALNLHNTLLAISPLYKSILADIREKLNLLPPSGAMAGIYSMVDNAVGVHKAPANVSVSSVIKPSVNITSEQQQDLNLPLNGKAVNAIRSFIGKGTIVWGARTLDGNSQDWRYINVRRAVIMIEQSIKNAAEAYVFEPNDANTWTSISSMLDNFLVNQWKAGVLVGATPEDAFSVEIGLGVTMTPVDILDGLMKITVKLAVSRPAEFIVITFQQQMQKS